MGQMSYMTREGDVKLEWSVDDPESIKQAKKTFKQKVAEGYTAFRVVTETVKKQGEQIKHFDPNAEEIILAAPMAGG